MQRELEVHKTLERIVACIARDKTLARVAAYVTPSACSFNISCSEQDARRLVGPKASVFAALQTFVKYSNRDGCKAMDLQLINGSTPGNGPLPPFKVNPNWPHAEIIGIAKSFFDLMMEDTTEIVFNLSADKTHGSIIVYLPITSGPIHDEIKSKTPGLFKMMGSANGAYLSLDFD
jgi:hypothetical protein